MIIKKLLTPLLLFTASMQGVAVLKEEDPIVCALVSEVATGNISNIHWMGLKELQEKFPPDASGIFVPPMVFSVKEAKPIQEPNKHKPKRKRT
jgi:hypothetical protein